MKQWRFGPKQVISMERPPKYPNGFYENLESSKRGSGFTSYEADAQQKPIFSVDVSGNRTNKS